MDVCTIEKLSGLPHDDVRNIVESMRMMSVDDSVQFLEAILPQNPEVSAFLEEYKERRNAGVNYGNLVKKEREERKKKDEEEMSARQKTTSEGGKKKKKEGPLGIADVDKIRSIGSKQVKNGREACECQAQLHLLVNNCLKCGRIVCQYEGEGPCFFCGTFVDYSPSTMKNKAKGKKKDKSAASRSVPNGAETSTEAYVKAIALKERLLSYDENSVERTQVTDLASDFTVSKWDSEEVKEFKLKKERERIEKQQKSQRRVITIDFEKRSIIEEKAKEKEEEESIDQQVAMLEAKIRAKRQMFNPSQRFIATYIPAEEEE